MTPVNRKRGGGRAPPGCTDPEIGAELDRLDDEDLDDETRGRIEGHVADCEACGEELELRLEVGHALRRMEEDEDSSPRRRRGRGYALAGVAAAVVLAALMLMPWTWSPQVVELRLEPDVRSPASLPSARPGQPLRLRLELTVGRTGDRRDLVLVGPEGRHLASASRRVQAPPPRVEWRLPEELPHVGRYTVHVSGAEGGPLSQESFSFAVTAMD